MNQKSSREAWISFYQNKSMDEKGNYIHCAFICSKKKKQQQKQTELHLKLKRFILTRVSFA